MADEVRHPSPDELLREPPPAWVLEHLAECDPCWELREDLADVDLETFEVWDGHPPDDVLRLPNPGPRDREHIDDCPRCRIHRRRLLAAESTEPPPSMDGVDESDPGTWARLHSLARDAGFVVDGFRIGDGRRPYAVGHRGSDAHLLVGYESHEAALVAARFEQVHGELHPMVLPWRELVERPGGWLARADPPPRRSVAEALALHPLAAVRLAGQASVALATLHELGLVHGGLLGSALGVTDTGRLRLAPPALHVLATPDEDRRHLGGLIEEICLSGNVTFGPLLGLAGELQQGSVSSAQELLIQVLEIWELVRAGAGRFALIDPLGIGGLGEVWRARDGVVHRNVALKFLKDDARMGEEAFVREARMTARLQHPNIVPIYDIGETVDGRTCYTMEEVGGLRLDDAIERLHGDAGDPEYSLRRLVDVYARIAETLAFAHDQGIVHSDLKPQNVMLGEYGEVRVMDWGMAAAVGEHWRGGTEHYVPPGFTAGMPPKRVDPRVDVFAFGRLLLDLLFGVRKPEGAVAPPGTEDLLALARHCLQEEPAHRPPDGGAIAARLRAWLDGQYRRERAEQALDDVRERAAEADRLRAEAGRKRAEAARLLDDVKPWDPGDDKVPAWALEDRAKDDERRAAVADTEYEQGVRAALELDPGNQSAKDALAEVYKGRLLRAEASKDEAEATRIETLLGSHDGGRHVAWIRGDGAVTLVTDPPGATVVVERYELGPDRRLIPKAVGELGRTPIVEQVLPRGSYRLRIRHPDCDETLYPVFLDRGEHWHGVPPEGGDPFPIVLPAKGSLGEDDCYVPAGWFGCGGDPMAIDGLSRRRVWIDGFVVQRFPVTHGAFVDFLNSAWEVGDTEQAHRHAPKRAIGSTGDRQILYARNDDGHFLCEVDGRAVDRPDDLPVVLVDVAGAAAYAAWRAREEDLDWRLPHDIAWEKAARGVDRRAYPWGDLLDPTFALMGRSHSSPPSSGVVTGRALDRSPYGVRGLGGNVRDWCGNEYRYSGHAADGERLRDQLSSVEPGRIEREAFWMARGGSWTSMPAWCRSAVRFGESPSTRSSSIGFRLARSVYPRA